LHVFRAEVGLQCLLSIIMYICDKRQKEGMGNQIIGVLSV